MKTATLLAAIALATAAPAAHAQTTKWVPTVETETWDHGFLGQQDLVTRLDYDKRGNLILRYEKGLVLDSIVSRYDDLNRLEYRADYRGDDPDNLYFYTFDEWEYDDLIPDLAVWHLGHQQVDDEWNIYSADKLIILRDEDDQIVRVGDYYPSDTDDMPDIPKSYVKTFANVDGRLSGYKKESYMIDPVSEEAYLRLDEEWSDIVWDRYAGQVLDPNDCFKGKNRIKSARVYDEYYGYTYDLSVTYGGAHPDDFEATIDIPSIGQRKLHTLTFTDDNGSFDETFRTYRLDESGAMVLSFVERVRETYDERGNITLQERALTADVNNPENITTRQGKRWVYTYDDVYGDWTRRSEQLFSQSYVDGEEGTYENVSSLIRSEWKQITLVDGIHSIRLDEDGDGNNSNNNGNNSNNNGHNPSADRRSAFAHRTYNLAGQPTAPLRGISIKGGRKSVR